MQFDYCRAQADTAASDVVPTDLSMLGKGGTGKKGKGYKTGKGTGKGKKGESNRDEKDKEKDKDKKGKSIGKNNTKAAEYFARYCLHSKGWGHMKKDCWRNESAKGGKETASLEAPSTPAADTTTEPSNTGMFIQSDESEATPVDPTQWLYSMAKQEYVHNDFLIDSGAAMSVCQQSLVDCLGEIPRGPGVELRSATGHQFTTNGNTTLSLRTRDGINVAGDFQIVPKDAGLQRSVISVGQVCDRGNISTFRSTGGTILNEFTGSRI